MGRSDTKHPTVALTDDLVALYSEHGLRKHAPTGQKAGLVLNVKAWPVAF